MCARGVVVEEGGWVRHTVVRPSQSQVAPEETAAAGGRCRVLEPSEGTPDQVAGFFFLFIVLYFCS